MLWLPKSKGLFVYTSTEFEFRFTSVAVIGRVRPRELLILFRQFTLVVIQVNVYMF